MMRPLRASVIGFSLLTSAATAHAECAWVLWGEVVAPALGGPLHEVESAHPSLADCDETLLGYVAILKREGFAVTGGSKRSQGLVAKKNDESRAYRCLPDTVDPRGPKGK